MTAQVITVISSERKGLPLFTGAVISLRGTKRRSGPVCDILNIAAPDERASTVLFGADLHYETKSRS